jgi:flagellar assembly protein FliH
MSFVVIGRRRVTKLQAEGGPDGVLRREADLAALARADNERRRAAAEAEGYAAGEAAARTEAAAETARITAAVTALAAACNQLTAPLAGKEHDLAGLVTELAFVLAQHMMGVEVTSNAEGLKAMVARLLQEAAAERGGRQTIVVRLHPEDHPVIEARTRLDNVNLLVDVAISRGGALVEIISPDGDPIDKIEWDATIEARVAAMREALGLDPAADSGTAP